MTDSISLFPVVLCLSFWLHLSSLNLDDIINNGKRHANKENPPNRIKGRSLCNAFSLEEKDTASIIHSAHFHLTFPCHFPLSVQLKFPQISPPHEICIRSIFTLLRFYVSFVIHHRVKCLGKCNIFAGYTCIYFSLS